MKVVILAGGVGSRLAEETDIVPKPMIQIGERPILWHIMDGFARQGHSEFHVAIGYKGEIIKRFFHDYVALSGDMTVSLKDGTVAVAGGEPEDWTVHLIETGDGTMTGGRLGRVGPSLGDEPFLLTYGDGLSDVDLNALIDFHRAQGKLATITAVHPPSRFGEVAYRDDDTVAFTEKSQMDEGWINGGFMVLEPAVLERITGDDSSLEADVLEGLAAEHQLAAYRHEGFWQCMDTLRDVRFLRNLWDTGDVRWR